MASVLDSVDSFEGCSNIALPSSGLKELSKSASKNSLSVFYKSPILMKEKSSFLQGVINT